MDQRGSSRLPRLMFDGDEGKYELWETKVLGHLHLLGLKVTVLREPNGEAEAAADAKKNADAYAELIQLLDDKSLSLIMRDAPDNGRKALKILRDYYAGKGKPRIIHLYTTLTSLQKRSDETVTDYIIRAETAITALRNAGETLSDGLLIAMVLKGLPESFKPFAINVTHNKDNITFPEFKMELRSFEDTEKFTAAESSDNVMKTAARGQRHTKPATPSRDNSDANVVCFKCGLKGHRAKACRRKTWCSHCKSNTHNDTTCRHKGKLDGARKVADESSNGSEAGGDYAFRIKDTEISLHQPPLNIKEKGLMVDTGATSHIVNDITKFKKFDDTFNPERHCVELADGTLCKGIAQKRGDAEVFLIDSTGQRRRATLRSALFIPSYPQDIFSVKSATALGATVTFKQGQDVLTYKDENKDEGNLPRILTCGHIYCTNCLLSIQSHNVIRCPDCQVESTLPADGVLGLQEESSIIGVIYTAKISESYRRKNKLQEPPVNNSKDETEQQCSAKHLDQPLIQAGDAEKTADTKVDEALAEAAENLCKLIIAHEALTDGLTEQLKAEKARLEMEINQAADKALCTIQKWKTVQINEQTELETKFFSSQPMLSHIQERIKSLKKAMEMARELRRVPFLEQYCVLDKLLETLRAPVESFDLKCISLGSRMSCVFQEENLDHGLALSLKMEIMNPKLSHESPSKEMQLDGCNRKSLRDCAVEGGYGGAMLPNRQEQNQENPRSRSTTPSPKPSDTTNLSRQSSSSDLRSPDVIVEEVLEEAIKLVNPPSGPDMSKKRRYQSKKRKYQSLKNQHDSKCVVVVSHIVSPAHFYVRHVADRLESEILSRKIHHLCSGSGCSFAPGDSIETQSLIFVLSYKKQWCRSKVIEIFQKGCTERVKICPVTQLAMVYVFSLDFGFCRKVTIQSEDETPEGTLKVVNEKLRKICEDVKLELSGFVPQAIRCSLKDLVPYDLSKGWDNKALVAFRAVTGSAALEMQPLGRDRDALLVDLKKIPMDQYSDIPISIREHLVFNEVARFYYPVISDRRALRYYPPVYPKVNTELSAVVCHISNPGDFYVQAVDSMESLLLSARLQDCYNAPDVFEDEELKVYCPEIGQPCVARFEENLWYRAQVIGCPRASKVEVLYVDFGNKKIIPVSDLRKIKEEFFMLPAMATPCCLADVIPLDGKTWSEACTSRFIALTYQKLVLIFVTEKVYRSTPIVVQVFENDEARANIAEVLVQEELACWIDKKKNKKDGLREDDAVVWDPVLELSSAKPSDGRKQNEELLNLQIHQRSPDQLKDLAVRISHVCSPSSFHVRFTQYDTQLQRIGEKVKSECELSEPLEVAWKADMFCAAFINEVWERGQICADVTSTDTAEVRLCDHGNTEKLHVSNLRPLPSSLIGSMALECCLDDIRPAGGQSGWTATAVDLFSLYVKGAVAVITIKELTEERPVPVTLFCSNKVGQYVSMSDFLVREGLALWKRKPSRDAVIQKPEESDVNSPTTDTQPDEKESSTSLRMLPKASLQGTPTPPKPSPRFLMTPAKVKTSLYNAPELPCRGHVQMTVTAVGDDGLIYARTEDLECQLQQLCERIQQTWQTLPKPKPYTWKSVLGCAVFGSDMLWYRGQILSVLGGNVEVQYVDHGFVENIPMAHVYPVLLCADVPQLCIPCQLHAINPLGGRWQEYAVAFMRELLQNRFVDVQILDVPSDPRGPLTVQIFLDGLNLNDILCHHSHGSVDPAVAAEEEHTVIPPTPIQDVWEINTEGLVETLEPMLGPFVSPNPPQEGEHFKVKVKHLHTPNELFLWPLEGPLDSEVDGETLQEALARINANISALPHLTCFNRGYPCLAEYRDGKYYRAKLLQITSLEPVTLLVKHVDFGSDDTLPPKKLRQMPAELLKFPTQVLKVRVAGFKAPTVSQQEDVIPYSPEWTVAAAMEMLDLLHGNITATVVIREPEVVVQLHNEDGELLHLGLVNKGLVELE